MQLCEREEKEKGGGRGDWHDRLVFCQTVHFTMSRNMMNSLYRWSGLLPVVL